jgi:hypothetical protein
MKTSDFNQAITSKQLKENLEKQFGARVNLEKYDREQLEDIRNKLRTRIFQQEGTAGMNDLLTNETYQKDKAMLELLNTRIKEMLGENIKQLRDKMMELSESKNGQADKKKCPPMSHIKKMCQDGKSVSEICKMHPDCDHKELKQMVADCKMKMNEAIKKNEKELEGNAFGKAVRDAKKDGIQSGEKIKVGGKEYPVKEENAFTAHKRPADAPELKTGQSKKTSSGGTATKTASGTVHKAGSKGYGNKWDGKTQDEPAKASKASKTSAEKKAAKANDIKLPPHKGNVTRHSSNHGADRDDGTGDLEESKPSCGHTKMTKGCKECAGMYEAQDTSWKKETPWMKPTKPATSDSGRGKVANLSDKARRETEKKYSVKESMFKHNVRFVNESISYYLSEDEEGKAKAITAAGDMVNDFTSWMQRVGSYQTKSMIELADAIRADFGPAEAEAFKNAVGPALSSALDTLTQQREAISNAVAALAGGEVPEEPMGMEPATEPGMDMSEPDAMNPEPEDEFGASDAAAGMGTTGREMRESKFARKLQESHSIMSKLAR